MLAYYNRGVVTTKTKSIAQGNVNGPLLSAFLKGEIKLRVNIGVVCEVIDGRGNNIVFNGHYGGQSLPDAPAAPSR